MARMFGMMSASPTCNLYMITSCIPVANVAASATAVAWRVRCRQKYAVLTGLSQTMFSDHVHPHGASDVRKPVRTGAQAFEQAQMLAQLTNNLSSRAPVLVLVQARV